MATEKKITLPEDIVQELEKLDEPDDFVAEVLKDYYGMEMLPECQSCGTKVSHYDINSRIDSEGNQITAYCGSCLDKLLNEAGTDTNPVQETRKRDLIRDVGKKLGRISAESTIGAIFLAATGIDDKIHENIGNEQISKQKQRNEETYPENLRGEERRHGGGGDFEDEYYNCQYSFWFDEYASITVEGTIENTSDRPLKYVDIGFGVYANDHRIGTADGHVRDLEVGNIKEWSTFRPGDFGGESTRLEVEYTDAEPENSVK